MNERIKELIELCYEKSDIHDSGIWFNKEKFAELIVRECVNKITAEQDVADQNWSCKNGKHIAWEMLDHFGIDT